MRIALGVSRTRGQFAETKCFKQLSNRTLGHLDAEAILNHARQIHPAPAHDPVNGRIGTSLYDRRKFALLAHGQARRTASVRTIAKARQTFFIVPMNPVSQRLAIHAATLSGLPARFAVQYQSQREHAPGCSNIVGLGRRPAQSLRVVILTRDLNFDRHG